MGGGLPGIRFNIVKTGETDGRTQNPAMHQYGGIKGGVSKYGREKGAGMGRSFKRRMFGRSRSKPGKPGRLDEKGGFPPEPPKLAHIPKEGSGKGRPLGISCREDKLAGNAVAEILRMTHEPKFMDLSFGFRPGINCHGAMREIIEAVQYRKAVCVVEADVKSFFDAAGRAWLIKFRNCPDR
ncbi:MAG: reverse transcriptase [Clostridiales bacterium]|jgi:retron-type reverse transcriptase|nr:reverse transcriptase [Clostridiales bacterium]